MKPKVPRAAVIRPRILEMGTLHKKRYATTLAVLRKNIVVGVLHAQIFLIFKAWFFSFYFSCLNDMF